MAEQYQPLYSAKEKSPINFMLILGLGAAVADILISGGISGLFIVGIGVAIYAWFTTPTNYSLYNDRLLIFYGRPRTRHIMFENIEGVDSMMVPLSGPRLRVREFRGRGAWLTPRDPDAFMEQFRIAMDRFKGTVSEESEESRFVPFQQEEALDESAVEANDPWAEEVVNDVEAPSDQLDEPLEEQQEDPWGRRRD